MAYTLLGLIFFTCFSVPTFSAQTQCHFTVPDYNNNNNGFYTSGYTGQKSCFFGCCSTTTYDPCCPAPSNNDSLGAGAIGGIVIGVIIALIIFGAAMFLCYRYNNKKDQQNEKYMAPAKPDVSYIATSEVTDITDLSRLPPKATYDEDGDFPDSASHKSKRSDAYSQQSESKQYSRPTNLAINQKSHKSTSSINSREYRDGYSNRSTGRSNVPSISSVDSMDHPQNQYQHKPSSPSSVDSMDHSPKQRRRVDRERYEEQPHTHSPRSRNYREKQVEQSHRNQRTNEHRERNEQSSRDKGSSDHNHIHNRLPQHNRRGYANSISSNESRDNRYVSDRQSVTSAADSIGTTV